MFPNLLQVTYDLFFSFSQPDGIIVPLPFRMRRILLPVHHTRQQTTPDPSTIYPLNIPVTILTCAIPWESLR